MQSDFLKIENLTKKFGGFTAVDNVSFSLQKGEAFALLGESGCGKTTLLRCIAGLDNPNSGTIRLNELMFFHGKSLIPVNNRNIGLVFQDYALFPHKSVDENITFGVKEKGLKAEILNQMIKLFKLDDQRGKMPDQLSGGQLQRVAIARTLAASPAMILLDEPFSNLDKQLGVQLRDELKEIFKSQQLTSILVTHDQQEAFAHADTVAVMKEGKILQTGTPESVYLRPESLEVAEFLGNCQFFSGTAHGDRVETDFGNLPLSRPANGAVKVLIRPENISLTKNSAGNYSVKNEVFLGSSKEVTVTNGEIEIKAILPSFQNINNGSRVSISVNSSVVAFP